MDFRRYIICITLALASVAVFLYANNLMMFPADFLGWYYPFRGYQEFYSRSPFLDNLGLQDVVNCFFPYRSFVGHAVGQGVFPLWNPLEGAGMPPGALHSNGSYFPLFWITYALFKPLTAWHIGLTVQVYTAATGSYLLFQRWSGNSRAAAIGSLSWTFGGWSACYLLEPPLAWPLALFPAVLLGLDDISIGRKRGPWLVALGIAGSLYVGHLQITIAAGLLVAAHIAFCKRARKGVMLASCTAGVLLALPHLVPLLQLSELSNRVPNSKTMILSLLLEPREFLGLFFQNLMGAPRDGFYLGSSLSSLVVDGREHGIYAGLATVLLALLAAWRLKDRSTRAVLVLTILSFIFACSHSVYSILVAVFPSILFVTPLRFLPFAIFGLCYLATFGWKSLEERPLDAKEWKVFGGFIAALVLWAGSFVVPASMRSPKLIAWLLALAQKDGISKPPYYEGNFGPLLLERILEHLSLWSFAVWFPLLLLLGFFLILRWKQSTQKRFVGLACLLCLDLGVYLFTMSVPVDQDLFFPQTTEMKVLAQGTQLSPDGSETPRRVIGLGRGLHPSIPLVYGIANFESYQSIFPGYYREIFTNLNGGDVLPHIIASTLDDSSLTPGLLDLFGVSKVYNHPSPEKRADRSSNLFIQSRDTALRAFLLDRWRVVPDNKEIYEANFEPRKEVLLEIEPKMESASGEPYFQTVEPSFYGYNTVMFQIEAKKSCLLVLTDLFYPGWTVTVNGQEEPILKAYGFVRAVVVPKGPSTVVMTFRPTGFRFTLLALLVGFLLLVTIDLRERWAK
jgi:membrane protein YfhO